MADWPPSLKPIGKFMARAREVEATNPLVAYYCNFYSLKRAIKLRNTEDEAANRFVTGLLEKCEAAQAAVGRDDGTHLERVQDFALSVFDRADTEDRAGKATKATAITFYAAMCFIEVCTVLAPLTPELEERLRYAKWKAADITKALREGRKPVPGAPGEAEARAKAEAEAEEARVRAEIELDEDRGDVVTSDGVAEHVAQQPNLPPAPPPPDALPHPDEDLTAARRQALSSYPAAPKYPSMETPSPLPPTRPVPSPVPSMPPVPTLVIDAPPAGDRQHLAHFDKPKDAPKQSLSLIMSPDDEDASRPLAQDRPVAEKPKSSHMVNYPSVDTDPVTPVNIPAPFPRAPVVPPPAPAVAPAKAEPAAPALRHAPVANADFKPSAKQAQEAQRFAKYAASALDFQDVKTAVSNLEQALRLLQGSP